MSLWDTLMGLIAGKHLHVKSRFEILEQPTSAPFGEVFKVREKKTQQEYSLKVLDPAKLADYQERFSKLELPEEGEILEEFEHENIIALYEHGLTTQKQPYLLLEWLEGRTLDKYIRYPSNDAPNRKINLIRQGAEALATVHRAGYLHRDVCAENFMVSADGRYLKLVEFSLAVPISVDYVKAGLRYQRADFMAPESTRRFDSPVKLEVFSFGLTAYHLCAGRFPWDEENQATTVARAFRQAKDIRKFVPNLNRDLAGAIMRALIADPRDRTGSMDEFLQQIRNVKNDEE